METYNKRTDDINVSTWALPKESIARLGRGWVRRDIAFSPKGVCLAIATDIGCWLYDLDTMVPRVLWDTERGMVSAISFSHDAQWIATGNTDGTVRIWSTETLQYITEIETGKPVFQLSFSPDGQYLACVSKMSTGSCRTSIYIWRENTDTPIIDFSFTPKPGGHNSYATAFSHNGELFAYTSDYNIISVINVETNECIAQLPEVYTEQRSAVGPQLIFSHCGKYLSGYIRKNRIYVWDLFCSTMEKSMEYNKINRLIPTFTSDSTLRVACISDNEVVISNAAQQEKVDTFEIWGPSEVSACFSADGSRFIISNRRGDLYMWTETSSPSVNILTGHLPGVRQVGFSKDSRTLVSNYDYRAGYRLWNVESRQIGLTFLFQYSDRNSPGTMVISQGQEFFATTNGNGINIWDIASGTQISELTVKPTSVRNMAFSPTGEYLVITNTRGLSNVYDVASGTQISELTVKSTSVHNMAFSLTGEYLTGNHRGGVTVWNTMQWEKCYTLSIEQIDLRKARLRFHPNGEFFIIIPREGNNLIWDLKSGDQVGTLSTAMCSDTTLFRGLTTDIQRARKQQTHPRRIWGFEASPRGTLLAGGMWDEIRIWDAATLETRMVIIPPEGCQKQHTLAFSPCSRYLASGTWWQGGQKKVSIRLWEVATGENIHTFWGHTTDVQCLAFSPDGRILASGSFDGTILLWDMMPYLS